MIAGERSAQTPWKRSQDDSVDANVTFKPACAPWMCCPLPDLPERCLIVLEDA